MKSKLTYGYRITATLLLFVYLVNPLRVFQPYLVYQVNQEYIAKVLCVNKDKPKLNCNGKCHLAKELKKVAEEESDASQNRILDGSSHEMTSEKFSFISLNSFQENNLFYPSRSSELLNVSADLTTPPPRI